MHAYTACIYQIFCNNSVGSEPLGIRLVLEQPNSSMSPTSQQTEETQLGQTNLAIVIYLTTHQ